MTARDARLTIVLPLRGRPEFTLRSLEYAERARLPFPILVADGGDEPDLAGAITSRARSPHLDLRYVRYPFDAEYRDYYAKMADALARVDTPFAAMIDNDAFHVVPGLTRAVDFLAAHPDHATCRGAHFDFRLLPGPADDPRAAALHGDRLVIDADYFDRRDSIWWSFDQDRALDRIAAWAGATHIMYYNVHRTDVLRSAWTFIRDQELVDLFMTDVTVALFALAHGRARVLDEPFAFRQQNSPLGASREVVRRADILDRLLTPEWTRDLDALVRAVAAIVTEREGVEPATALAGIRASLKRHYADRLDAYLRRRRGEAEPVAGAPVEVTKPADVHPDLRAIVELLFAEPVGAVTR